MNQIKELKNHTGNVSLDVRAQFIILRVNFERCRSLINKGCNKENGIDTIVYYRDVCEI